MKGSGVVIIRIDEKERANVGNGILHGFRYSLIYSLENISDFFSDFYH